MSVPGVQERPLVSVVVNNFNYEEYLGAAIDSALSQEHSPLEVIVVDDGSTDRSRAVIESYGDRVRAVYKENGGQASALEAGFDASSGEIVMILDADDYLAPDAAKRVAEAIDHDCSKVQFRLSLVDADGRRLGADPPRYVPMPNGDVVPQLLATGRYTTPVTSGNAYPRSVLGQLLPIPPGFRDAADSYVNTVCPLYGKVVSLDAELGSYRQHGRNFWSVTGDVTVGRIRWEVEHDLLKARCLTERATALGLRVSPDPSLQDAFGVLRRLASLRLDRQRHPVPGDTVLRLARAGTLAIARNSELPPADKILYLAELAAIALLPVSLARRAATWTFSGRPRSRWLTLTAAWARRTTDWVLRVVTERGRTKRRDHR
jgi:hypothetical protein